MLKKLIEMVVRGAIKPVKDTVDAVSDMANLLSDRDESAEMLNRANKLHDTFLKEKKNGKK